MTLATVTTTFINHFTDQNWKYSRGFTIAFIVNHKGWIVDPVCCDILWARTFCCEKKNKDYYVLKAFYILGSFGHFSRACQG